MLGFTRRVVAVGAAVAMFSFGSVAKAQECVTQADIDSANAAYSDAAYNSNRKQAALDNFETSYEYLKLEDDYYNAKDKCHRFPPGWQVDPRDVQDCEDRALEDFHTARNDQITALENDLAEAEMETTVRWADLMNIISRPLCPVE